MLRCTVRWTCEHCRQDFDIDPDAVDMPAVLTLTDSHWPECGRAGAVVTLIVDTPVDSCLLKERLPSQQENRTAL